MDIEISPAIKSWIAENLAAGRYLTPEVALESALQKGIKADLEQQRILIDIEAKIQEGIDALVNGDFVSEEELLAEIEELEESWV